MKKKLTFMLGVSYLFAQKFMIGSKKKILIFYTLKDQGGGGACL